MQLSYAQNMEDYHLAIAFEDRPTGFYIDVGAGHPVADNVSLWFYQRGWRGVVVEPQHDLAQLYPLTRPRDLVHQGLIGRDNGAIEFFHVDRLHGFSTTVRDHADSAKNFGANYKTVTLPVITLAALCEKHRICEIDFLKIDVEGAEVDVLRGSDWNRFRPKIIVVEAVAPGNGEPAWSECERLLLANGYRFRLFDTLNRFYVAEEHPDLFERLPAERAPWDAVTHMYEIGRAPEHRSHPDHQLALQLARGFWSILPHLDDRLLADILGRGNKVGWDGSVESGDQDQFRIALGRIACGYDGGQIVDE
jgi:FkbM family methyltransferase